MIHYVCPVCESVTPLEPGRSRIKKKCPNCGERVASEEVQRLTELWVEEQKQISRRKQLLPILLGIAIVLAIIVGAFAESLTWFGVVATALIAGATLCYRCTVNWI